jgi:hypothetical protein
MADLRGQLDAEGKSADEIYAEIMSGLAATSVMGGPGA